MIGVGMHGNDEKMRWRLGILLYYSSFRCRLANMLSGAAAPGSGAGAGAGAPAGDPQAGGAGGAPPGNMNDLMST